MEHESIKEEEPETVEVKGRKLRWVASRGFMMFLVDEEDRTYASVVMREPGAYAASVADDQSQRVRTWHETEEAAAAWCVAQVSR